MNINGNFLEKSMVGYDLCHLFLNYRSHRNHIRLIRQNWVNPDETDRAEPAQEIE